MPILPDAKQRTAEQPSVISAGAAGGGIGTLVATAANALPEGSFWKSVLIVSSPLLTVGISGLWLFVKAVYVDPYINEKKQKAADRAMDRIISDARRNTENAFNDPNATLEHKKDMQSMVEKLEKLRLQKITDRMQVIDVKEE